MEYLLSAKLSFLPKLALSKLVSLLKQGDFDNAKKWLDDHEISWFSRRDFPPKPNPEEKVDAHGHAQDEDDVDWDAEPPSVMLASKYSKPFPTMIYCSSY